MRTKLLIIIIGMAVSFAFLAEARAQGIALGVGASLDVETITPKRIFLRSVYSVKFLCGTIPEGASPEVPAPGFPLVPGTYLTAINIHNPNPGISATVPIPLTFRKKALITNPQGQPRGRVSQFQQETLKFNEGLEVDCENIRELLNAGEGFLKGFVVIDSPLQLDVVAIYTLKNVLEPEPQQEPAAQ
jgi:hypothetical protein